MKHRLKIELAERWTINASLLFLWSFFIPTFGQVFANTGGVIGVISARQSLDGRPLLWQNFDSDEPAVEVLFFRGKFHDYLGLINGRDTTAIYSGMNTTGFGIVRQAHSQADSSSHSASSLVKQALSICGSVEEFKDLWQTAGGKELAASFACIDAFGNSTLFCPSGVIFATDPVESPDGFLIRAHFSFGHQSQPDSGFWRYHRSRDVLRNYKKRISPKTLVDKISRDIQTLQLDPYELPYNGKTAEAPQGYAKCMNSINQYNTVAAIVIQGIRPQENPDFATLWAVLGEPLCGVAVPLWPATGTVPIECRNGLGSLNAAIRNNERAVYNKKQLPEYVDTIQLADKNRGLLPLLENVENYIFKETLNAIADWKTKADYLESMIAFQSRMATWTLRSITY